MTLHDAQCLALGLMSAHGLAHWKFGWNNRLKSFGVCSYRRQIIWLSKPLTLVCSEDEVRDTLLHEIAHAKTPFDRGHGVAWKQMAIAVGAKPVHCSTAKATIEGPWKAVCRNCGTEHRRYGKPRKRRACGICCKQHNGGLFADEFELTWRNR